MASDCYECGGKGCAVCDPVGLFGPEYPKIHTMFKRDEHNVIVPGDWSVPEFEYLADRPWQWTEKVDGTNIRLHWNGSEVRVGGRTDNAQVPARLIANIDDQLDPRLWKTIFPDANNVTVYGEGYGAKIQSGGMYRQDQSVIVFDVLVGSWWLSEDNVLDVAIKLGLEVVPFVHRSLPLVDAIEAVRVGAVSSQWPDARIEGLVGRPVVDLFNRRGERIMAKVKVKDWRDYERRKQ